MARPYVRRQQEPAHDHSEPEQTVQIVDVTVLQGNGGATSAEDQTQVVSPPPQVSDDERTTNDDEGAAKDTELFELESAPKNGMSIFVHGPDGQKEAVIWRTSRQFNRNTRIWEPRGRWVHRHVQPPRDIDFEPIGWSVLRD
jgi:hypothetical protein